MSRKFKTTGAANNLRKLRYFELVAPFLVEDPIGFQVRYLRGLAFKRELFNRSKRSNVIALATKSERKNSTPTRSGLPLPTAR